MQFPSSVSRFYLILAGMFFLAACSERCETSLERVYDLPPETNSISYKNLHITESKDSIQIRYGLGSEQTISRLYLRSAEDFYFLKNEIGPDGVFTAAIIKSEIKRGVYEIGISDESGAEVSFFNRFISVLPPSESFRINSSELVEFSFEKFAIDSQKVLVQGWAYLKNQPMHFRLIQIGLVQNSNVVFYATELQERKDVTAYFNPPFNADHSGFHAIVPTYNVPRGEHHLMIRIVNLIDSSKYDYLTERNILLPEVLDSIPQPTPNIAYNLEAITNTTNALDMRGWAYLNGKPADSARVYLLFKKDVVYALNVEVRERKDVTSYFQSPYTIDRSGFHLKMTQGLPSGTYQLGVMIINGSDHGVAYFNDPVNLKF